MRQAIARRRGARGRKRALDWHRPLRGCDHEWEYHEDTIGDYGVVNGTYTECWLECLGCGRVMPASTADRPDYDDYGDYLE